MQDLVVEAERSELLQAEGNVPVSVIDALVSEINMVVFVVLFHVADCGFSILVVGWGYRCECAAAFGASCVPAYLLPALPSTQATASIVWRTCATSLVLFFLIQLL